MLSAQEFSERYGDVRAWLEKRRKNYLTLFYINCFVAFLCVGAAVFFPSSCLGWLAGLMHRVRPVSGAEIISFQFFGFFCAVLLIATPVLRYRGGLNEEYSLKRIILLRIAELLGDCALSSPASSFIHLVRESGMFPAGAGISERVGITGTVNGLSYSLEEMAVTALYREQEICLFKGLLLVINPLKRSENTSFATRRRLLLGPEGLVSPDALNALYWDKAEYITPRPLQGMAAVSTHALQMQDNFGKEYLTSIQELALRSAAKQAGETAVDSKLLHDFRKTLETVRESLALRSEKPALAAEKEYEAQFCAAPDLLNSQQLDISPFSVQALFSAALLGDTYMLALPCPASLFAPESLFRPAFEKTEAEFLYALIEWISAFRIPNPSNR